MNHDQIQTVHGVSSPVVRGFTLKASSPNDEPPKSSHKISTQLYRDETARRLEENNEKAEVQRVAS